MSPPPRRPEDDRNRPDDPAARVAELRATLEYHGHRYYVLDDPEIGDDAYDVLLDELRGLEAAHPELLTADSPTQRAGGEPVSDLVKVHHPVAMLSLANVRSSEELTAWIQRMRNHLAREGIEDPAFEFVAEPKIDGLAMSLLYRDGVLERGATRGNGEVGARTSLTTSARSARSRCRWRWMIPRRWWRSAGRSTWRCRTSLR